MKSDLLDWVQAAFERAVDAPVAERGALLDELCGDNATLRREVESLLQHDSQVGPAFMPLPADAAGMRGPLAPLRHFAAGQRLGHYKIIRQIGAGGMGSVYEALQEQPLRRVALKVLRPEAGHDAARARFQLEAEVLGRLRHPNIAQVYEAGVHDEGGVSIPYFALELIEDAQPLLEFADRRQLDLAARLRLFAQICHAVHYGHQRGVIHRDLKPANLLIDADGQPKIIDFGVARLTDEDVTRATQFTHAGDLIGTVRYMSPEQCGGDPAAIDVRSDVYALGVVLYELCTGRMPYDLHGTSLYSAVQIIQQQPARRPSLHSRAAQGDLEVILLKALEKEPSQRYGSAADLAQDIDRYLTGQPIEARPPTLTYILGKYARKHWLQSLTVGLAFLALIAVLAALAIQGQLRASEVERHAAKQAAVRGHLQSAETAIREGDSLVARNSLRAAAEAVAPENPGWIWRHLDARADLSTTTVRDATRIGGALALSANGERFAVIDEGIEIWDVPTARRLAELSAETLLEYAASRGVPLTPSAVSRGREVVRTAAFSTDGSYMALALGPPEAANALFLFAVSSDHPRLIASWRAGGTVQLMTFDPTGTQLVTTMQLAPVRRWRIEIDADGEGARVTLRDTFMAPRSENLQRVAFSPDGRWLAANFNECTDFGLWDLARAAPEADRLPDLLLEGHTYHVWNVAFSPDSRLLVSGGMDRRLRVWDLDRVVRFAAETGATRIRGDDVFAAVLDRHIEGVRDVLFSGDGRRIYSAGDDGWVLVWERSVRRLDGPGHQSEPTELWEEVNRLHGHGDSLAMFANMGDGRLVAMSWKGEVKIFQPLAADLTKLIGTRTSVDRVCFAPDGAWLYSGSCHDIRVWDPQDGGLVDLVRSPFSETVGGFAVCRESKRTWLTVAFGGGRHGRLAVFALDGPRLVLSDEWRSSGDALPASLTSLAATSDGRRLAAGTDDGRMFIFELNRGTGRVQLAHSFKAHDDGCPATAFLDHDGHWLATGGGFANRTSGAAKIRVWYLAADNAPPTEYRLEGKGVGAIAVNSDRTAVAVACGDGAVYRWALAWRGDGSPDLILREALAGHIGPVLGAAFQPHTSPQILVSAGEDSTVRFWDWESASESVVLRGPLGPLHAAASDPDGRVLATPSGGGGGRDNVVYLWEADVTSTTRTDRAHWLEYRPRLMTAIGECRGLLLSEYPQKLHALAAAEDWPAEIVEKALARYPAFIEDRDQLVAPAWAIACDPDARADRYHAAADHAEQMIRMDPWSARAHTVRGALAYRLGDFERASAEFRRCEDLFEEGQQIGRTSGWYAEWEPPLPHAAIEVLLYARLGDRDRMNDAWTSLNKWLNDSAEGRVITDDDLRLIEEARNARDAMQER